MAYNKEEIENETVKLELSLEVFPKARKGVIIQRIQHQSVTFMYDRWTKGKRVAMILNSVDGKGIDAPDHEIYFNHEDLKNILEFLLKQK